MTPIQKEIFSQIKIDNLKWTNVPSRGYVYLELSPNKYALIWEDDGTIQITGAVYTPKYNSVSIDELNRLIKLHLDPRLRFFK